MNKIGNINVLKNLKILFTKKMNLNFTLLKKKMTKIDNFY